MLKLPELTKAYLKSFTAGRNCTALGAQLLLKGALEVEVVVLVRQGRPSRMIDLCHRPKRELCADTNLHFCSNPVQVLPHVFPKRNVIPCK